MDAQRTDTSSVDPSRPGWWDVVAQMWSAGASPHTIAAALNQSPWSSRGGKQWHWRQVAAIVCPEASAPRMTRAALREAAVDDARTGVLLSLEEERLRAVDLATRIALHVQAGDSTGTIAARLNRAGLRTQRGTRWTAKAVAALLRPGGELPLAAPLHLRAG